MDLAVAYPGEAVEEGLEPFPCLRWGHRRIQRQKPVRPHHQTTGHDPKIMNGFP